MELRDPNTGDMTSASTAPTDDQRIHRSLCRRAAPHGKQQDQQEPVRTDNLR